MKRLQMKRLGDLMKPESGNPKEVEGVLNPAAVRGPDGHLYLFPRMVSRGNYSRIGIARVRFDTAGNPSGVERLGIALEPEAAYEKRGSGGGGCEDPRVTFVEPLGHYVMTYTALSWQGPRIALAVSKDLFRWRRLGLVTFEPYGDIAFDGLGNKDASVFPVAIPGPNGCPSLAIIHRPLFPGTLPEEKLASENGTAVDIHRESIWISYRDMSIKGGANPHLCHFTSHHRLAAPIAPWEILKIGGGPPPILTSQGWMLIYHGVCNDADPGSKDVKLRYSAGMMMLSQETPTSILYRSPEPLLTPELPEERVGTIGNVVFPTGIDQRNGIHSPHRFDVYYGMADDQIGVARLDLPQLLPSTAVDGKPEALVPCGSNSKDGG
jgi:predicted GH43/DUF377 family glycosyl hydrolase